MEQKTKDAKATEEEVRQKLTDSRLHSVGLEKTLEDLRAKMAQDEAEQTKQKKEWAKEWEAALWDSKN